MLDKTLLERVVEGVPADLVDEVIVAGGYKVDAIKEYFRNAKEYFRNNIEHLDRVKNTSEYEGIVKDTQEYLGMLNRNISEY